MSSTSVRRHRATGLVVLFAALVMTGVGYAAVTDSASASVSDSSPTQIAQGRQLFLEGCATCHGLAAQGTSEGPGLIGVGAAAVDFQVSTGRMPLAAPANQAPPGGIDPAGSWSPIPTGRACPYRNICSGRYINV